MKLKKIKVPKYVFKDELGEFLIHDVEILVDAGSGLDAVSFCQERDDYLISSDELRRIWLEAKRQGTK